MSAATTVYSAELPDGRVVERRSARTYTHLVAIRDEDGWGAVAYCGDEAKAARQAIRWTGTFGVQEVRIVPVVAG